MKQLSIKANSKDKSLIVHIISETFDSNPSVNSVIGSSGNRKKKIKRLAEFAFVKALNKNGAYLSNNMKGAALFYRADQNSFSFKEQWYELKFALTSIPIRNILKVLRRESYFKKRRPQDGKYYYFWFLGVLENGNNAGFELKNIVLRKAKEDNLPIYLETSVYRNVIAYQRFGFEIYHEWEDVSNNGVVWFMRKEADSI
jgi:hypothetical protein